MNGVNVVRLYGIRSCDTCRNALKWLERRGVACEYSDIRAEGFDEQTLRRWLDRAGWEALVNQRSVTWRKIPDIDRSNLDAERAFQLIISYPTVLKRPVLESEDDVILGFDEDRYAALFPDDR